MRELTFCYSISYGQNETGITIELSKFQQIKPKTMNRNLLLFIVLIKVSFIHGNDKILNPVCIDSAGLSKQYHVVELTNEEIVYDAYQVKSEVAERTFIGEARMIFTDDNIVLEFELQDYFVSTKFDYIIPDREVEILMRSICKRFGNEYLEYSKLLFFGAGSAISFTCGNKEYLLVEK